MNPAENVLPVTDVALHQCDMVLTIQTAHKAVGFEISVFRGHIYRCDLIHQLFVALAVRLQVPDGNELDAEPLRQRHQLGGAHHGAVLPHDLTAQAAFLQPRQTAQVNGGLRMALPLQHAVFLRQQREHMARSAEILRPRALLHAGHRRHGALGGGDAGGGGNVVDGHREGRFVVVGVVLHHLGELQLADKSLRHGHTDQALAVGGHEVDVLRGGKLGGADEIAFVFTVGVVCDQNDLPLSQILQCFGNGIEIHGKFSCQKPQRSSISFVRVLSFAGVCGFVSSGRSSFSIYLPTTSVSKFTGSPRRRWLKLVWATV